MTQPSKSIIAGRLQTILAHLNGGRLDAAATACAALRQAAPDDPAVLQMAATIASRSGDPQEAARLIWRSLARRPAHVPSLIMAARIARDAGVPVQAVGPLRQAMALAPSLAEPAFLLCLTLLDLGDPALGTTIAQAESRFPGHGGDWQALAVALHRAGRGDMALAAFTRAAAADPALAPAQFGRGLLLREAGRLAEAQAALSRAVALDPMASSAWFALGLTCQDRQDEEAAAAVYESALKTRPDFAEAAVNLGIARQRLGDMEAALAAYRCAMRIRPDSFARIAQAVTAAATGMLWLDLGAFRRWLAGGT